MIGRLRGEQSESCDRPPARGNRIRIGKHREWIGEHHGFETGRLHFICGHGYELAVRADTGSAGGGCSAGRRHDGVEGEALEQEAREILAVCRKYGVPLLINDDVMLAKKIGAEGVHVGQSDMAAAEARSILGPDAIIGVTARTIEQAQAAEKAGADYLGSGAVFGTSTKKDAKPLDPAYFQQICESVSIPVVAIGGITANNIRQLEGRKMSGFAIVSGIFAAQDIEAQTKKLWKSIRLL